MNCHVVTKYGGVENYSDSDLVVVGSILYVVPFGTKLKKSWWYGTIELNNWIAAYPPNTWTKAYVDED